MDPIIKKAQDLGSTACTRKGALRYLKNNRHPFTRILDKGFRVKSWDRQTSRSLYYSNSSESRYDSARISVPLGTKETARQDERARNMYPRRKNWLRPCSTCSVGVQRVETIDCGPYSRRCTYIKKEYRVVVSSWALILMSGSSQRKKTLNKLR